jgi:hypothetical protein
MDVFVYSVFVLGSGLATGCFSVQGDLPTILDRKLKRDKTFHVCPVLRVGATGIEEEEEEEGKGDGEEEDTSVLNQAPRHFDILVYSRLN